MDYQNRAGSKKGGGGVAGWSETQAARKQRLRQLALETIDLDKDPYIFKNHVGTFECRLCLTTHVTDGSYLIHTQSKKHQTNLAKREAMENREKRTDQAGLPAPTVPIKKTVKIGRPGYKVVKIRDPVTKQHGLLFEVKFPEIGTDVKPRYRFMSAYEQKVETPPDRRYQYLLVAAEPYETIAFKIESHEVDRSQGKFFSYFDRDSKVYTIQLIYKKR